MKNCVYNIFEEVNETKFPGFKEVTQLFTLSIDVLSLSLCVYACYMVYLQTTWLECIQETGDIIFVPSGWHHQVYNLVCFSLLLSLYIPATLFQCMISNVLQEDTISVNHNWLNAYNLSCVVRKFLLLSTEKCNQTKRLMNTHDCLNVSGIYCGKTTRTLKSR